jgi:choline dehydrogenase-like flavoprotein
MEIDLELVAARVEPFRSQVCVIGAGIAGLTLAHRLSQQGIDVALLEAGGRTLESPDGMFDAAGHDIFAQARLSGEPHVGTTAGRSRVFGGSSLGWGGQLLPLATPPDTAWPISNEDLAPHYRAAERLLGVDDLPYDFPAFFERSHTTPPATLARLPELTPTLSKWTPFTRRNLATLVGAPLLASRGARIYLRAQATELVLDRERDHLEAVLVRTLSGATFRFEASHYILAAGTVETSRLLLASRSVAPEGVGNAHDQVGRNFHDHLTLPAGVLTGAARATLLREFRPWVFDGGRGATLHSLKLEASAELRERFALNPVLAHLTINEPEGSGVAVLRDLLLAVQHGNLRHALATHAVRVPSAMLDASSLWCAATLHHRRFVSARAAVALRLNAAQDAPSLSRIELSDQLDPAGVPQPVVDWRITARDITTLRSFAVHLHEHLAALQLDGFHWLPELFTPDDVAPLPQIEDARHAMGGACMGHDPRSSVVNADLTVHGIANLSIASAATFPNGSPPLPTLPLMALSLRLADRLAAQLLR